MPYSRLIETSPANLPTKLDSDSKLQCEKSKLAVSGNGSEPLPKNSVSDSKLAVDYFNAPIVDIKEPYALTQSVSCIRCITQIIFHVELVRWT